MVLILLNEYVYKLLISSKRLNINLGSEHNRFILCDRFVIIYLLCDHSTADERRLCYGEVVFCVSQHCMLAVLIFLDKMYA